MRRGQRVGNREELSKLVTFVTSIRMGASIDRRYRTKGKAIKYIVDQCHATGNRGKRLAVSVAYDARGTFSAKSQRPRLRDYLQVEQRDSHGERQRWRQGVH